MRHVDELQPRNTTLFVQMNSIWMDILCWYACSGVLEIRLGNEQRRDNSLRDKWGKRDKKLIIISPILVRVTPTIC